MSKALFVALIVLAMAPGASAELIVLTFPSGTSCATEASGLTGPNTCSGDAPIYQGYGDTAGVDFTYRDNPLAYSLHWW